MWLSRLAINRPIAILMLVFALLVMGWRSMKEMPAELNPSVNIPYVTITTNYAGAGPAEIETLVTKPVEDSVAAVNGIKNITSTSQEGASTVSLEFYLGINPDVAASDVRQKVDAARGSLPRDADSPVISKLDFNAQPILTYGLKSNSMNNRQLRDLADNVIQYRFSQVPGVGQVNISGGDKREIRVSVDKNRLAAYDMTIGDVVSALGNQNLNMPGGKITEGSYEYSLRTVGEFTSVEELRKLQINTSGKGPNSQVKTIRLEDIGSITDTSEERTQIARVNGKDSVSLIVSKLSDANPVEVSDGVKKAIAQMQTQMPVQFVLALDTSRQVRAALHDVNLSLILGSLLAIMVVFLFLHDIRGTFIVGLAIPTSLIATFIPIHFFGFSLNQMTMLGLSLVVGVLVDDSIVVLENIHRHLQRGERPREAALNGRTEIGLAALTITMVDVVVFVPIAFMGGIVGQFFRQFGITVACATLFSLFVSFTFTPMLASRWYKPGEDVEAKSGVFHLFDRFYHGLDETYRRVLRFVLGRDMAYPALMRIGVVAVGYGSLIVTMMVFGPKLGFQFFPVMDQGQIVASIEYPAGTSLSKTDRVTRQVEQMMGAVPEAKDVFSTVGYISGGGFQGGAPSLGPQFASISLTLKDKINILDKIKGTIKGKRIKSSEEVAQELRPRLAQIAGPQIVVSAGGGVRGGAPIAMELTGPDLNRLEKIAGELTKKMATVPGVLSPDVSVRAGRPEVQVQLDRVRAADLGVNVRDAASALHDSFEGNTDAKYREGGEEYDIRVELNERNRENPADVGQVEVNSTKGNPVQLKDVATISVGSGPTKIDRKNRFREVVVSANLAPGYPAGNVQREIDKAIKGIDTSGAIVGYGGDVQSQREEFPFLIGALGLGAMLVYMLMAALFNSLLNPFIIMLSLPMAFIGAIVALVLFHESMSIVAMIGIIMLMGLVTKNAILLIDYINTLRLRGYVREDAIEEAGPTRLRPILMTTVAMVFGMLPIALRIGEASEMRAPMAIVVMGGLILSTVLTLVIIPVTYTLFDDVQQLVMRFRKPGNASRVRTPKTPGAV